MFGLLGGVVSGISSLFGTAMNNATQMKAIKAQQQENEKTRQYNLNLARMQNQWSIDQWNRENAYNDPSAQMARYSAAGLNPDLIYGQQNLSAASPAMTSGAAATPTDMSGIANMRNPFGDAIPAALEGALKGAQLGKLQADTSKTNEETIGKAIENYIQGHTKDLQVRTANLNLQILGNQYETSKFVPEQMAATIKNLNVTIEEGLERIRLLSEQVKGQRLTNLRQRVDNYFAVDSNRAALNSLIANTDYTKVQAYRAAKYMTYEFALAVAQAAAANAGAKASNAQAALLAQQAQTEIYHRTAVKLGNESLRLNIDMQGYQADILMYEWQRQKNISKTRQGLGFVDGWLGYTTSTLGNIFVPAFNAAFK